MGNLAPSVETISAKAFQDALLKYQSILDAVSAAKGAKDGQQTLAELDNYRYNEVVQSLNSGDPPHQMELDDIRKLVQWKLRHGKFRPKLMELVSSNDAATAKDTIARAMEHYRDKADAVGAIKIISELRGIGPATASLLLAVHDPEKVIFFGDEVFYWLCCGGKVGSAKYNMKEYQDLQSRAATTSKRLGVPAVDIEKVAYVVMKQGEYGASSANADATEVKASTSTPTAKPKGKAAKRKLASADNQEPEQTSTLRRSKRGKKTS